MKTVITLLMALALFGCESKSEPGKAAAKPEPGSAAQPAASGGAPKPASTGGW